MPAHLVERDIVATHAPGPVPAVLPAASLLLALLVEPRPTIELADRLRMTLGAVSQHLKLLHTAGLLTRTRDVL